MKALIFAVTLLALVACGSDEEPTTAEPEGPTPEVVPEPVEEPGGETPSPVDEPEPVDPMKELEAQLKSDDEETRLLVADKLGETQGKARDRALVMLESMLSDESSDVRQVVAIAIQKLGLPELSAVRRAFRAEENEDVKRALMTTLFQLGGESSIPELITVANDSMLDESFRAYAIDALGRLRATKARSYLEEAAEEMSPVVRRAAIIALGLMESESSLDLIGERIGDNDQQVRIEAIRAVKAMAKRRSVSYLINEIETEDPETLDEIIEALRVITGKKMGYDTEKSLEENGPVVKKWMAWWEENKGGY